MIPGGSWSRARTLRLALCLGWTLLASLSACQNGAPGAGSASSSEAGASDAASSYETGRAMEDAIGSVTDQMLRAGHAERPEIWPTYGGDWAQTRYSPLDEIDTENVRRLRPAWIHQTGINGSMETTPIVLGREMYITTPAEEGVQDVIRLDAATGEVVWARRIESTGRTEGATEDLHLPTDFGPHRGVAVYGDRVYMGTLNGTLLALERETGDTAFEVETLSPQITGAPLAARGLVVVGLSWIDRGAIQAFDADTGGHVWTWYTIPSPEEGGWWGEWLEHVPGQEEVSLGRDIAQEKADSARLAGTWRTGGGSAPMTPSFDPSRGLIYTSVGGPDPTAFPPPAEPHPGDMRWTNGTCALGVESGELAWCEQYLPHDIWGASGPTPPILFELETEAGVREAVARFTGMGNLYVYDREGGLLRVSDNYVPVEETRVAGTGPTLVRGGMSGTVWSPGAYNPGAGLLYSTNQSVPGYFQPREQDREAGQFGNVAAVDPRTGEVVWRHRTERPLAGGVLTTAGGLVFAGRTSGWLDAYDARTGDRVWSFRTGAGCNAAPMTYRVEGRQHVAVACGGHAILDPDSGSAVLVFSLP